MAINIKGGRPNGVTCRESVAASSVFNASQVSMVFELGDVVRSWAPGRDINGFTNFISDRAYYVIAKVDMDKERYFAPPMVYSSGITTTTTTTTAAPSPSFYRYATSADVAAIPNANLGDYIIDGPNSGGGVLLSGDHPNSTIGPGKKIIIKNGNYDYIYIDATKTTGTENNPVIITNYGGQVVGPMNIIGSNLKITGRYDAAAKTGHASYPGFDTTGDVLIGQFGFYCKQPLGFDAPGATCFSLGGPSDPAVNNVEVEYLEAGMGGYAGIMLKNDNGTSDMDNIRIHDCFVHDTAGGEGFYIGSTGGDPQHQFTRLKIYNNLIVRTALNAIQAGQLREDCEIYNNTIIGTCLGWSSAFGPFQDQGIQMSTRRAGAKFYNNLVIGAGENWLNLFLRPKVGLDLIDDTILFENNAFLYNRNTYSVYINSNGDTMSTIEFNNNIFGKHNFIYNEIYPTIWSATADFEILCESYNSDITVIATNNLTDQTNTKGATFVAKSGHLNSATVIESNNTVVPTLPAPEFQNFMELPVGFDHTKMELWVGIVPTSLGSQSTGGQPRVYNTDDYVMYRGKLYRSLVDNNANHTPPVATDSWWELVAFDGGQIPDNARLSPDGFYNLRSIGRNWSSTPTTTTTTSSSSSSTTTTTTTVIVATPGSLILTAEDNGDNTLTLDWGVTRGDLVDSKFKLVGMGTSTMNGTGSAIPNNLPSFLQNWLTNNTQGGVLLNLAISGTNTNYALSVGMHPNAHPLNNCEAAMVFKPDAVFLSYPSNDPLVGLTAQQTVNNLLYVFNYFTVRGVPCFVSTTQPRNSYNTEQQQTLADTAALIRSSFPSKYVIDVFDLLRDTNSLQPARISPTYHSGDAIHLNAAGQQLIFDKFIEKLNAHFQDSTYEQYEIERSTSPTSGFVPFDVVIGGNQIKRVYPTQDGNLYYYRVRGVNVDNTTTPYSNTVSLQQPIDVGEVDQIIQIDFSNPENPAPPLGWNKWEGSTTIDIPVNTQMINLVDHQDNTTSVSVRVTRKFGPVIGASNVGPYPINVTNTAWTARGSFSMYSQLMFSALSPTNTYQLEVFTSGGSPYNVALGVRVNGTEKQNFEFTSGYPTSADPNPDRLITLKGLIPNSSGQLLVDFLPLMYGLGMINALVLKRCDSTYAVTTTTTTSTTASPTTTTTTTLAPGVPSGRILIDLGGDGITDGGFTDTGVKTPDNSITGNAGMAGDGLWWNNIVDCRAGTWISSVVDTNNNPINGFSISADKKPGGTFQPADWSVGFTGAAAPVGDYPLSATRDFCLFHSSAGTVTLTFTIPAGKKADVKLWGSRADGSVRTIQIRKSTDIAYQEYNASNNTNYSNAATIVDLIGTVNVEARVKSGSTYGHIGVIDVTLYDTSETTTTTTSTSTSSTTTTSTTPAPTTSTTTTTSTTSANAGRTINVNLYSSSKTGGTYIDPAWNNWNFKTPSDSATNGFTDLKYEDGSSSGINLAWGAPTFQGSSDNTATYGANGVYPQATYRHTPYSNGNVFIVISGLDNESTYDFEFMASRSGTAGNKVQYRAEGTTTVLSNIITADNNVLNTATISNITPSGGVINLRIAKTEGSFNYLNAFKIFVNGGSATTTTTTTSGSTTTTTSTTSGPTTTTTSTTTGPGGGGTYMGRQLVDQFPINASGSSQTYGLTWLPTDYYSPGNTDEYPLIIFLHGGGETGTTIANLSKLYANGKGSIPEYIAEGWNAEAIDPNTSQNTKFIVCSPQAPSGSYSYPHVKWIVPNIISRYRVDPNRVYITGLSYGGAGTLSSIATDQPTNELFAAACPIAVSTGIGAVATDNMYLVSGTWDVRVWSIRGAADGGASLTKTYHDMINGGPAAPVPPEPYTSIAGGTHSSNTWGAVYNPTTWKNNANNQLGLSLYEWFLLHSRAEA
jgi:predicted peptidase/lysophospholipase L1-like esterase